jgi:hypothetical protein
MTGGRRAQRREQKRDEPPYVKHARVKAVGSGQELGHIDLGVSQPAPSHKNKKAVASTDHVEQQTAGGGLAGVRQYRPTPTYI